MYRFLTLAGFLLMSSVFTAELPPYLPPAYNFKRVETIPVDELPLRGGGRLGNFIIKRSLNGNWKFSGIETSARPIVSDPEQEKKYAAPVFDVSAWDEIPVPLNWYVKYPEKQNTVQPYARGYYRTGFDLTAADLAERRVLLEFDVVGYDARVFLNGIEVGAHHGDFTPFKLDVTAAARVGQNVLTVRVLSDNGPTFGVQAPAVRAYGSQWAIFNIKGGIWQDVRLSLEPVIRAERMVVTPDLAGQSVRVACRIVNSGKETPVVFEGAVISAMKGEEVTAGQSSSAITLKPGVNELTVHVPLKAPRKWSVNDPYLYFFLLTVKQGDAVVSAAAERFGYREFKCESGKFYLNGKEIYLFGENISSVFYGGSGESPQELTRRLESYILNNRNVGYVILRNAHMPIVPEALAIADECGMMIYNEWAWCFTNTIDAAAFGRVNSRELEEFFFSTTNHPSVVMWSLGNEIVHRDLPLVVREMNRQVALIRSLDEQKRPICTFSGVGGWKSYGENKLDTDVLDSHCYTALSSPWTKFMEEQREWREGNLRIYGKPMPMIAWENVGFSWGYFTDDSYEPGTVEAYAVYASKPANWGSPNGTGFTGTAPLWKVLKKEFKEWAQGLYGRRIFELYRLDPNFAGFAPWFGWPLPMARHWTQPLLPSLHSDHFLFPRNLFTGGENEWNFTVAGVKAPGTLRCRIEMVAEQDGKVNGIALFPALPSRKVTLKIPTDLAPGHYQMRLTLLDGETVAGRNFYDVFLADSEILTHEIAPARKVCVWDTGAGENVARLESILKEHGMVFNRVEKLAEAPDGSLLIVPAAIAEQQPAFGTDPALEEFTAKRGGTLLVLAQKNVKTPLPGGEILVPIGNSFVDQIIPDHPVFAGLDYRCFDTWNNPEYGFVVSANYQPFTLNAVAAKGPMLGRQDVGMVLVEAVNGRGRIILSQFNATACRELDSAAATYLYNLLRYASGAEYWSGAKALVDASLGDFQVEKKRLFQVDLSEKANAGFRDDIDNDGKGGWTDQGDNDFRMMPTGIQEAAGITFNILDPEKNDGYGCLVVRGTNRPHFPTAIRGIKAGKKLSRLFFLHTAAWSGMGKAGAYRVHHGDGTFSELPLESGVNIGDWWNPGKLPQAKTGILRKNSRKHEVGTFVTEWENPKPHLPIVSIDFLSASEVRGNAVDYLPEGTPVPVLVAITGEKAENSIRVTGEHFKGVKGAQETGGSIPAQVEVKRENADHLLKVAFEASSPREVPAVILFYEKKNSGNDFHYITFMARSRKPGTIQLLLPQDDWKAMLRGDAVIAGDGQWRKYRLRLGDNLGNEGGFRFDRQRGELVIYYRSKRMPDASRPAWELEIKDITIE